MRLRHAFLIAIGAACTYQAVNDFRIGLYGWAATTALMAGLCFTVVIIQTRRH